ncbi:hypothetical protein CLV34_2081 [Luteimicrobium subarcticum]|uniref:DUF6318 domain-containing protein n=2 Tax=Luteimicrobium subarcticum TaxID=620910 RepID=A0A2M8WRE2_9MICO|nr:DUF6318 family protein [Luteimicrobium subarcticum]PJI93507.1 hypothetical protein CLV34_2081 [Luteimicrobium subarcticum]
MAGAVLASAAIVLLGGCTTGDDARAEKPWPTAATTPRATTPWEAPTTTARPTPSTRPSSTQHSATAADEAPERPAAMNRDTAAGARAAVAYFISLYPYVMATHDMTAFDAMCNYDTSEYCRRVRTASADHREKGDSYTGGAIRPTVTHVGSADPLTGARVVDATVEQDAAVVIVSGKENRHAPAVAKVRATVVFSTAGWKVMAFGTSDGSKPDPPPSP